MPKTPVFRESSEDNNSNSRSLERRFRLLEQLDVLARSCVVRQRLIRLHAGQASSLTTAVTHCSYHLQVRCIIIFFFFLSELSKSAPPVSELSKSFLEGNNSSSSIILWWRLQKFRQSRLLRSTQWCTSGNKMMNWIDSYSQVDKGKKKQKTKNIFRPTQFQVSTTCTEVRSFYSLFKLYSTTVQQSTWTYPSCRCN